MFTRVVVSGGWSYGNLGDEVITRSTIELVNKYFSDAEIIYTSYNPKEFMSEHGIEAEISVHKLIDKYKLTLDNYAEVLNNLDDSVLKSYANLFDENTLFIMSGGGYFDGRWIIQFVARIMEIEIAKKKSAKVAIIGQSIGPLVNDNEASILKETLDKCDFINVRDDDSKVLLESIGLKKNISCTCDIAIIISDILKVPTQTKEKICNLIVQIYTQYVPNGLNVKNKNNFWNKILKRITLSQYRYDRRWISLIRKIDKETDYKPRILINIKSTDDFEKSYFIKYAKMLKHKSRVDSLEIVQCKNYIDFCEKLAEGEMTISCKMHPLIVTSSYGKKTYAFSQHFKIDAFMKWMGRADKCEKNYNFTPDRVIKAMKSEDQDKIREMALIRKEDVYNNMKALSEM